MLEAIVTLAIVTSGIVTLVGLARQVTEMVARSRRHLSAAVLADAFVSRQLSGPLVPTRADCLESDVAGCMTLLDDGGRATASAPAFVRRWRIDTVATAPTPTWSLTVCVVPIDERRATRPTPGACIHRVVTEVTP